MEPGRSRSRPTTRVRHGLLAIGCAVLLGPGATLVLAQEPPPPPAAAAPDSAVAPVAAKIPPEQLDSLVAPIALYPDALLAQTLVASTYPLEIIQLQQWLAKNPDLKDDALAEAVAKQPWDPSIQSMAVVPDVVKRLADDVQWTTDLGNAFLAQQQDVMDCRPADAQEGQGQWRPGVQRAADGGDEGGRAADGHHRGVREPRGHLRADRTRRRSSMVRPSIRIRRSTTPPTRRRAPPSSPSAWGSCGARRMGGSCCGCGWGG